MNSFLITFKPAAESPDRGWPLEKYRLLVERKNAGQRVEEMWRFRNRSAVALGDRVFLVMQGRSGPALVGYGSVAGLPKDDAGTWRTAVEFEAMSDPSVQVFANATDLREIEEGKRFWRSQASGILLPASVATRLEALVVGKQPKAKSGTDSNPDWTSDELILALNIYLQHRANPPGKHSEEIRKLSAVLHRLGEKLFSPEDRADTFRNEDGVYMKLMNFRRLDPEYTSSGRAGLSRGAKAEEEVWLEFSHDAPRCQQVANAIIASLDDPEVGAAWLEKDVDDGIQEAAEGRLLTRKHIARERNRRLVESKRKQVLKKLGKLVCEICTFDFAAIYGERGDGFVECHHTKPVATLAEGQTTHINDLALVCANCHRVIHRSRPWLSIAETKQLLEDTLKNRNG